jgi:glycosyltransferase involved in cell wall biosynthesis
MTDLLTIAIPVYNRDTYVRQSIESALNQTAGVPVIVVDNASTKTDFKKLLGDYQCDRLSYFRNESNIGMVGNWNRCIARCKTPYLLILHDDDLLDLGYADAFHKHWAPEAGIFFGRVGFVDAAGRVINKDPIGDLSVFQNMEHWCLNNPAPVGAIFSVEYAKRLGGFNSKLRYTPDFDFWFRLALDYSAQQIPAFAGWYREYGTAEQATFAFERSGRIHGFRRIQWKRNQARLRRSTGTSIPHLTRPGGRIPFSELVRMAPALNNRWMRYATAICLRTPPDSPLGKIVRPLLRILGPSLPRMLTRFRKSR